MNASDEVKVARRAGVVAVFTLMSRVLGYVRDAVLANLFGASGVYDAFIVAQTIPNLLRRLVAEGSLVIAFVPLLAAERDRAGRDGMRQFTAAVLGLLIPFLIGLSAAGVLFPEYAVKMFAAGFDADRFNTATDLTRIMMPYIFFVSLVALAGGILNTDGIFAAPAAAPIFLNIAIVVSAVLFRDQFEHEIEAVAWGVLVGGVLQLLLQIPFLVKTNMFVRPRWSPRYPAVITLGRRMLPAVFGVAVYQLNILVIRQLGSFLPPGQLTWYYSGTRLQEFALGVFAVSVSVAALPTLSEHAAKKDWPALRNTFRQALRVTNFITIPTMVGLWVVSEPVVAVLFRHGRFSVHDAQMTAQLLQILVLALVPIGAVRVIVPTFYALGDTKTPVYAASASLLTTFGLGLTWVDTWEIHGLTAAISVAAVMQLIVLSLWLRHRLTSELAGQPGATAAAPSKDASIGVHALRCLVAVIPSALMVWYACGFFDWLQGSKLVGVTALGTLGLSAGLLYFGMAKMLHIRDADLIIGIVKQRIRR
jgi:putative peptidoglycan lipid II flippase